MALAAVSLVLASQAAGNTATRHCHRTFTLSMFERAAKAAYRGTGNPPVGSYGHLWRYARCLRKLAQRPAALRYWGALHDAWAARRQAADGWDSPDIGDIPGVPRGFVMCVAGKESTWGTNPAADGNVYGIVAGSGYGSMNGMPLAVQKRTFARIYFTDGPTAWTRWEPPPACPT